MRYLCVHYSRQTRCNPQIRDYNFKSPVEMPGSGESAWVTQDGPSVLCACVLQRVRVSSKEGREKVDYCTQCFHGLLIN